MLSTPVTESAGTISAQWHPLADIFPWLDGADRAALVEDVRKNGVIEPIVFLDGLILDGRNRYTAAREAGVPYLRVDYLGADPLGFVVSRNLARRHLTESQRAAVAAEIANLDHGVRADTQTGKFAGLLPDEPAAPAVTQADAAKMLNVSERSVRAAVSVRDKGVPELRDKLRAGQIAVSAAAEIAKQPAEEQAAIVALPPDERVEKLKAMRAEAKDLCGPLWWRRCTIEC